jgi:translation initiation factor 4G
MLLIVDQVVAKQVDKLVQERVAECLKTHIPQELLDEFARSKREPPHHQPHIGSQLPHPKLPILNRNLLSALQGPSMPLSHTIASPVYPPPHPSALAHSSNSLGLTSPPPIPSTPSNRLDVGSRAFVPRAFKLTIKKADGTEVSLENLTKTTPTPPTPAISSPQSVVLGQGSPGTPNRRPGSIPMETEDQRKSRLAEQEQYDRIKAEAADKEKKEKERAEAERKAKVAEEVRNLKQKELRQKQEYKRLRKEAEALELQPDDGKDVDTETSKSMEDGKDRPKVNPRINTTSISSPTSDKRRPGPLDLTRSASPVVADLATARVIADVATVSYPEGHHSPNPDLNQNMKNGKFRYC